MEAVIKDNLDEFIRQFSSIEVREVIAQFVIHLHMTEKFSDMNDYDIYRFIVDSSMAMLKFLDDKKRGRPIRESLSKINVDKEKYKNLGKKGQDILSDMI